MLGRVIFDLGQIGLQVFIIESLELPILEKGTLGTGVSVCLLIYGTSDILETFPSAEQCHSFSLSPRTCLHRRPGVCQPGAFPS